MDRVVGWQRMPAFGLARLDRWTLEHRRAMDDMVRMYCKHNSYQRWDCHCERDYHANHCVRAASCCCKWHRRGYYGEYWWR